MSSKSGSGLPQWIRAIMEYASAHNRKSAQPSNPSFADTELPGEEERVQPIPGPKEKPISAMPRISATPQKGLKKTGPSSLPNISAKPTAPRVPDLHPASVYATNQERFFAEMQIFADRKGREDAPFLPFRTTTPQYTYMTTPQRAWYFCWRTQVRNGVYPKTDEGYLRLHIYELLSGVGWQTPEDGLAQLRKLELAYRQDFPFLCFRLKSWIFDFTYLHKLPYTTPEGELPYIPSSSVVQNILLARYAESVPLKLPFPLVEALCNYPIRNSKFYSGDNIAVIEEAIPRVIALADAALQKKRGRSLLSLYSPNRPRKQFFRLFSTAECSTAQLVEVQIPAYVSSQRLRGYVTELVRHAENVLRKLRHVRGKLQNISLDAEMATLVEAFLKREYAPQAKPEERKKTGIVLDQEVLDTLREQSDAVRDALEVPEAEEKPEKEVTPEEMEAMLSALTPAVRAFLTSMEQTGWEVPLSQAPEAMVQQIERLSSRFLVQPLAQQDNGYYSVAPVYWSALKEALTDCPPEEDTAPATAPGEESAEIAPQPFNPTCLPTPLGLLVQAMSPVQQGVLLLTLAGQQEELQVLADKNMTMAELLIDEINDLAMMYLDDILIDTMDDPPRVLEQYAGALEESIKDRNEE